MGHRAMRSTRIAILLGVLTMATFGVAWGASPGWLPNFPLRAGNNVLLMWVPVPGAQSYNVYRTDTPGGKPVKIGSSPATTYTDSAPDKSKTLEYIIRAVVNGKEGEPSAIGVVAGVEPLSPPKISGVRLIGAGDKVGITWDTVKNAVFYNIYKSDRKEGPYTLLSSVQQNQYVDAAVKRGTTVYYKLSAVNASSVESPMSEIVRMKVEEEEPPKEKAVTYPLVVRKVKRLWRSKGQREAPLTAARDLAVTREGNIAIVSGRDIQVVGPDGEYIKTLGGAPNKSAEVAWGSPNGIGVSDDGTFVVTYMNPTYVRLFSSEGELLKTGTIRPVDPKTTTNGFVKAPIPTDAGISADGTIWVVENQNFQLLHLDRNLEEIGRIGKPIGDKKRGKEELVVPARIAIDRKTGRMFVTESSMSRVTIFDKDGKRVGAFGTTGKGPGQFNIPGGIEWTPGGEILVGDPSLARIQAYDIEGKYLATCHDAGKDEQQEILGAVNGLGFSDGRIYYAEDVKKRVVAYEFVK